MKREVGGIRGIAMRVAMRIVLAAPVVAGGCAGSANVAVGGGGGDDVAVTPASAHVETAAGGAATPRAASAPVEAGAAAAEASYRRRGFEVFLRDGRLWVFARDTSELADFRRHGELAHNVTLVGAGPGGITIRGPHRGTILAYLAVKDGFEVRDRDERLWIFRSDAVELEQFDRLGELAQHVTRIGAGPLGATIKGPDGETLDAWVVATPGFRTVVDRDRRLWVFAAGSPEAAANELPEKHITLVGRGPMGLTLKAPDRETADAYVAARAAR